MYNIFFILCKYICAYEFNLNKDNPKKYIYNILFNVKKIGYEYR